MLKYSTFALVLGTHMAVFAMPASAQQTDKTPQAQVSDLEEITVTARRREENIEKIPVSVSAVSGERFEQLTIQTPTDLGKLAGLGVNQVEGAKNVTFNLRGQGTSFGTNQNSVTTYFAEVPNYPLQYFDLQNVQVVKGPQGTLFGATSTGGVILFEPQKPTGTFGGYADVQAGDYAYKQGEGALNLPIIGDKLDLRIAFQRRVRHGYIKAYYTDRGPDEQNNVDTTDWRISLLWRPTENVESYTTYTGDKYSSNGDAANLYYADPRFMNPGVANIPISLVPSFAAGYQFWSGVAPPAFATYGQLITQALARQAAAGPYVSFNGYSAANSSLSEGLINQTKWEILPNLTLRNIVGVNYSHARGALADLEGTDLPLLQFRYWFVPGSTNPQTSENAQTGGWPSRTVTEELQLQGKGFNNRLQWQGGFFYSNGAASDSRQWQNASGEFVAFGFASGDPADPAVCASVKVAYPCTALSRTYTSNHAFYGQATYEVVDDVHFTAGVRESWDHTRTDESATAANIVLFNGQPLSLPIYRTQPAAGAGIVSTIVDPHHGTGTYNLTTDWQVTNNILLYVAHRTGYKSGGVNSVADPGSPDRTFQPEHVKDVEIGAKMKWNVGDVHGLVNLDYYHIWYNNIQESANISGQAGTVTENGADGRVNGLELEGSIFPTVWFELAGNLAYTDAKYSDWTETQSCAAQYWRPQCAGEPGTTPIVIDHKNGILSILGQTINFAPDRFPNAPKIQWSVQPTILMQSWIGEDISIGANVYHKGPYVDGTYSANSSILAGLPPLSERTIFGTTADPFTVAAYTLVDLRVDWRKIRGSQFSLGASVTNATNVAYRVNGQGPITISGTQPASIGFPRMFYVEGKYTF